MKVEDFDFDLDESLIAQTPILNRDQSRLLVFKKTSLEIEHKIFSDITNYFNEGDLLILNNSKVIPARLHGIKAKTNAHIELLLLKEIEKDIWQCLAKPAKRVKVDDKIIFKENLLEAICTKELDDGMREFKMVYTTKTIYEALDLIGEMPIPPYIHQKLKENDRYQTVYAKNIGSAAAPTAGLHFTKELLEKIKEKGVNIAYVTLHVGLGTFKPVSEEKIEDHKMHSEFYSIPNETINLIKKTKKEGKKVICCGTTSVRTLESAFNLEENKIIESGWTNIFIYPGYKFKIVDALITNFHLPKSTLIMLVSAFASKESIMKCYDEAIKNRYRFFSFGDAMLII